jgi:predicted SAM-dependent methyltransferase
MSLPICLELGCGMKPQPHYTHHDKVAHSPWVDVAHDLDVLPWPWADEEWDGILAQDVVEHLRVDIQVWLDECWRILRPWGLLTIRVPRWDHWTAWVDPTHRRVFHPRTFDYWDKRTDFYEDYGRFYFAKSDRWWSVDQADPVGDGNLQFVLRKCV